MIDVGSDSGDSDAADVKSYDDNVEDVNEANHDGDADVKSLDEDDDGDNLADDDDNNDVDDIMVM